ncbi:PREDICTED: uncharacterized protein K02A2.6-like [Dufourea novaeangliae]|uniref:uncharacterized protein K02A2.6-like n=1 Tax=Dufourea novaeangliae TaxID=178035 RepID=UPI0007677DBA|nr:PREDICTED: uncharacterized protein K02A2.6-like [Dufourea novaeangliae]
MHRVSPSHGRIERQLHCKPKTTVPFETIHIDHVGPIDNQVAAKKYILVIIDAFTKFVKLYATKTTNSREAVECLKQYFDYYSKPKILISDRGSAFTSSEFLSFVNEYEIKHIKIATGSPQANGQVERVNRVVNESLSKLTDKEVGVAWYKNLSKVEHAINNTISKATGETPSKLLFGIKQNGQVEDEIREFLEQNINIEERNLENRRKTASEKIVKGQEYNKKQYDKRHKNMRKYKTGDWVMIRNFDSTAGASKKLMPQFKGPYKIVKELRNDRYVIADIEGFQMTQKPYKGVWEPANMRMWKDPVSEKP